MKVYLAGRIAGDCIDKCLGWRRQIINHYRDYKNSGESYPISFLDPLNSGESESVDAKGLTSKIPPNLIYDKDILSVEHSDVIVANMDDFFEEGIEHILYPQETYLNGIKNLNIEDSFDFLREKILNRRENMGTHWELAIAHYLKKPIILIVPERRREIFEKHPFTKKASVIVTSVDQLLEEKWLNILYKSIAGAC
jgi:nucleoside 2-deoxyribosyltransferase